MEKYFSDSLIEEIVNGAMDILESTGIFIPESRIRDALSQKGLPFNNSRVLLERKIIRPYFLQARERSADVLKNRNKIYTKEIGGTLNEYCTNLLDLDGRITPFTTDTVIQQTRFVEKLSGKAHFSPGVCGTPQDVPPGLACLARFKIGAQYSQGFLPASPTSVVSSKYMYEMCDVMGISMNRLPVYVASPLTLGGENLDIILQFASKLSSVKVTSMPSYGVTTPMSVPAAFSVALAEVLGSAFLVQELSGIQTDFLCQMHPFDFRALSFVYGSPEHLLFEWINGEFNAKIMGLEHQVSRTNIHTWAKTPGVQAASEKSALVTAGALKGARTFSGLGALSLDEIFSPVQLIIDLNILSQAKRLTAGIKEESFPRDLIGLVEEGLQTGYLGSDATLDNMQSFIWHSQIFTRRPLEAWKREGGRDALWYAEEIVKKTLLEPDSFRLEQHKFDALEKIWQAALNS